MFIMHKNSYTILVLTIKSVAYVINTVVQCSSHEVAVELFIKTTTQLY